MAIKPGRFDSGIQMSTGTASWQGATGVGGLYYKVGVGLVMRKVDNSEVTLGAGGSGTLATVYAGGASTSDSIMALDSTRGPVTLRDNASPIGTLLQVQSSGGSTTFVSFAGNATHVIRSGQADGVGNVGTRVDTTTTFTNGKLLQLMSNASERWSWQLSQMNMPGNTTFAALGAASANTTSLQLSPNVSDGASSVLVDINAGTTLSNATAKMLRLRNNGTELLSILLASTDGVKLVDGGGSSALSLSTLAGTVMSYGSSQWTAGSGSVSATDGTGIFAMAGGNVTATVFQFNPDGDGTRDFGTVSGSTNIRWRGIGGKRIFTGAQSLAHSATPAFDPTSCNHISIGPVTANITGPTMVSGSAGEKCTIVFRKDATASAYTITTSWGSNVRMDSTALAFTTGSGSLVVLCFEWDPNLSTPAWVERSRKAFN